jgi:hypothetical protein
MTAEIDEYCESTLGDGLDDGDVSMTWLSSCRTALICVRRLEQGGKAARQKRHTG